MFIHVFQLCIRPDVPALTKKLALAYSGISFVYIAGNPTVSFIFPLRLVRVTLFVGANFRRIIEFPGDSGLVDWLDVALPYWQFFSHGLNLQ